MAKSGCTPQYRTIEPIAAWTVFSLGLLLLYAATTATTVLGLLSL